MTRQRRAAILLLLLHPPPQLLYYHVNPSVCGIILHSSHSSLMCACMTILYSYYIAYHYFPRLLPIRPPLTVWIPVQPFSYGRTPASPYTDSFMPFYMPWL